MYFKREALELSLVIPLYFFRRFLSVLKESLQAPLSLKVLNDRNAFATHG
jgi:hypothetical protein